MSCETSGTFSDFYKSQIIYLLKNYKFIFVFFIAIYFTGTMIYFCIHKNYEVELYVPLNTPVSFNFIPKFHIGLNRNLEKFYITILEDRNFLIFLRKKKVSTDILSLGSTINFFDDLRAEYFINKRGRPTHTIIGYKIKIKGENKQHLQRLAGDLAAFIKEPYVKFLLEKELFPHLFALYKNKKKFFDILQNLKLFFNKNQYLSNLELLDAMLKELSKYSTGHNSFKKFYIDLEQILKGLYRFESHKDFYSMGRVYSYPQAIVYFISLFIVSLVFPIVVLIIRQEYSEIK